MQILSQLQIGFSNQIFTRFSAEINTLKTLQTMSSRSRIKAKQIDCDTSTNRKKKANDALATMSV